METKRLLTSAPDPAPRPKPSSEDRKIRRMKERAFAFLIQNRIMKMGRPVR